MYVTLSYVCPCVLFIMLLTYRSKFTVASRGFPATAWPLFYFAEIDL